MNVLRAARLLATPGPGRERRKLPAQGGDVGTRGRHHHGEANLAHAVVGDADHGHLAHGRVAAQHGFDLGGVDVEAAAHVHVLQPVGDGQVAPGVEEPDVTRVQPTLGVDRRFRGLGIVEVAGHHVVAAYHDLARVAGGHRVAVDVDDAHLDVRYGTSRRRRDHLGGVAPAAHRGRSAGLGQPVGGQHRLDAHVGPERLDELDGNHRGAGHHEAEGRQVEGVTLRVVEDRLEDGGRARQDTDPLVGHPLQHDVDVEHRLRNHRGTGHQASQDARLVAEGVEERVHDEVAVAGTQSDHLRPRGERPERLAVGGHGPLRVPGGTRREHEVGQVGRGDRRRTAGGDVGLAPRGPRQERLPPDRRGARGRGRGRGRRPDGRPVRAQDDDQVEVGQCLAGVHRLVE